MRGAAILFLGLCAAWANPTVAQNFIPGGQKLPGGPATEDHPATIQTVLSSYPLRAAQVHIGAMCTMTFDVNAEGRAENICGVCALSRSPRGDAERMESLFLQASTETVDGTIFVPGAVWPGAHMVVEYQARGPAEGLEAPEPILCPVPLEAN